MSQAEILRVQEHLHRLRATDPRTGDPETFLWEIGQLLYGVSLQSVTFDRGKPLFRAAPAQTKPVHLDRLSYPRSSTTWGRANFPGEPVLYTCSTREAPLFEVQAQVDQTIALTCWLTDDLLPVSNVGYTTNILSRSRRKNPPIWSIDGFLSQDRPIERLIVQYIAEEFARPVTSDSAYIPSAIIANVLMIPQGIHGLMYPTLAMDAAANNIAVRPQFADHHLVFRWTQWLRIVDASPLGFQALVEDLATHHDNGILLWQGGFHQPTPDAYHGTQRYEMVNGRRVLVVELSQSLLESEGDIK